MCEVGEVELLALGRGDTWLMVHGSGKVAKKEFHQL